MTVSTVWIFSTKWFPFSNSSQEFSKTRVALLILEGNKKNKDFQEVEDRRRWKAISSMIAEV